MAEFAAVRRFPLYVVAIFAFSSSLHPVAAIQVILRTGDPAPGLGGGVTIQSFLEPPSTNDEGHVLFHVTVTGTGVNSANNEVIYRWHRNEGFFKVARNGETVNFASGQRTLTFLETPIVDNRGWVAFTTQLDDASRGMVAWEPGSPGTLYPVVKVGESASLSCQKVDGAPCTTPLVSGPFTSISTFAQRQGAIFRTYVDTILDFHEILVRGTIDNNTFGDPEGLFRWFRNETGGFMDADSIASELEFADGTEAANYFEAFTDLAACDERIGLFTIEDLAPYTVYQIDELATAHTLLDRYYTVNTVLRKDLHCFGANYSYLGARGAIPGDTDQTKRGVFVNTTQIYEATVTSAEIGGGHTIGAPLGQALTRDDPPKSVFTANMIGTTYNGKAGVWRRGTSGGLSDLLLYELQPLAQPPADVATIWAVHVGGTGAVAFHALMSNGNQALLGTRSDSGFGEVLKILTKGDTVPNGAGGELTVDSFWTLGGTFGSDPVVTGTGGDGHVSALNARGEFVFVVNFQGGGAGLTKEDFEPKIFADGFDVDGYCVWSLITGGSCPA